MDSNEEVLMIGTWQSKGCAACRGLWERGDHPPELATNILLHARLHRCSSCGTYWEQLERYADTIDEEDARKSYPDAFHIGFT